MAELMRLDIHHSFDTIEESWDRLASRRDAPPFLRPGWFRAWWDAFGGGSLAILAVEGPEGLTGVLPLHLRGGVAHSLANYHTPGFGPLTEDPSAVAFLLNATMGLTRRRAELRLLDVETLSVVRAAAARGPARGCLVRVLERSPWIDLTEGWDVYRSSLDAKLLGNIARRRRRLEELGTVELEVRDGTRDISRLLSEGFDVEGAGWKAEGGTAIASQASTEAFYRSMSAWASSRGWLRLAHLRVAGRSIAFDLSLEHRGHHYLLKTGHDPEFARFGPGKILRHDMVRRAFDEGLQVYDFLGEAAPWKLEWTSRLRDRAMVQLFPSTSLGRIERATFEHARPLAKRAQTMARSLRDVS
jgi:CelD/BcsL family acetyltransferase involved in cellulose biosynthesis